MILIYHVVWVILALLFLTVFLTLFKRRLNRQANRTGVSQIRSTTRQPHTIIVMERPTSNQPNTYGPPSTQPTTYRPPSESNVEPPPPSYKDHSKDYRVQS